MDIPNSLSTTKLLSAIIAIHILVNLIFFNGLWILYGDQGYIILIANKILTGTVEWNSFASNHTFRMIPILGVALSFLLFGRNEFAIALPSLLYSVGCLVIIFYIAKLLYNEKMAIFSCLLLSFLPFQITFSTVCSPDSIVPFFSGASVLFFLLGESREEDYWHLYLLSALFLGLTYFVKETGLLVVLFYGAYALYHRRLRKEYLFFVAIPLLLFIGETLFYYWKTDIWFLRSKRQVGRYVKSVAPDHPYLGLKNYLRQLFPLLYFFYLRIFAGSGRPFTMGIISLVSWSQISQGYYPYFILLAYFYALKDFRKNHVVILWITLLFLYLQFGYISFNPLVRIAKIPRFLSILNIPGAILLANFLYDLGFNLNRRAKFINRAREGLTAAITIFLISTSLICSYRFSLWTEGKWPRTWADYNERVKQAILRSGIPRSSKRNKPQ